MAKNGDNGHHVEPIEFMLDLPPYSPPRTPEDEQMDRFLCLWCYDTRLATIPADLSPDGNAMTIPCHHCTVAPVLVHYAWDEDMISFPTEVLNARSVREIPLHIRDERRGKK